MTTLGNVSPCLPGGYVSDDAWAYVDCGGYLSDRHSACVHGANGLDERIGKDSVVPTGATRWMDNPKLPCVSNVIGMRNVLKIGESIIGFVSVDVVHGKVRFANEGLHNESVYCAGDFRGVTGETYISVPSRNTISKYSPWPPGGPSLDGKVSTLFRISGG